MPGQILWLLLLAASPVLLILILGTWQDALLLTFGVVAAIGSAILESAVAHTVGSFGLTLSAGGKAFVLFALPEETIKYFATISVAGTSVGNRVLVKSAVTTAVGFATAENLLYVFRFNDIFTESVAAYATLIRLFLPFSMHLVDAPILMSGHVIRNFKPIGGIFLAVIFHGIYDVMALGTTVAALRLSYFIMVSGFVFAGILYRKTAGGEQ